MAFTIRAVNFESIGIPTPALRLTADHQRALAHVD